MSYQGIVYTARIWPRLFWGVMLLAAARVTYYGTHPTNYVILISCLLLSAYALTTACRIAWKKRRVLWP